MTALFATPPARPEARVLLVLATLWSFAIQAAGAYFYPASHWNGRMGDDIEGAASLGARYRHEERVIDQQDTESLRQEAAA